MPRDAAVTLDFADGTYVFRLGWGELEKLQEAVDAGPYHILGRLYDGSWRVGYISHIIRLGLIGGGMEPIVALKKVREYVEKRPPLESVVVAQVILSAACAGAPEEEIEKKSEAPDQNGSTISPMVESDLEPSTASGAT